MQGRVTDLPCALITGLLSGCTVGVLDYHYYYVVVTVSVGWAVVTMGSQFTTKQKAKAQQFGVSVKEFTSRLVELKRFVPL